MTKEAGRTWTIYVCPKCGMVYNGSGGCGSCEPAPRTGHPRPVLERIEVCPEAGTTERLREALEAVRFILTDDPSWNGEVPPAVDKAVERLDRILEGKETRDE